MHMVLSKGAAIGQAPVSEDIFGGNLLFDRDRLDGTFNQIVDDLGVTGLRYPGGGLAEHRDPETGAFLFDVTRPDTTDLNGSSVMAVSEFIAYATANDLDMSFVIPTSETYGQNYRMVFGDPSWSAPMEDGVPVPLLGIRQDRYDAILAYARDLIDGRYGEIDGAILEIGNEFYSPGNMSPAIADAIPDGTWIRHTAESYGIVASSLAKDISEYATAAGKRHLIEIHVQAGRSELGDTHDKASERNSAILAQFDEGELAAVDGVISHFYPRSHAMIDHDDPAGMSDIKNARAGYIDAWEAAAGRDLTFNVSEWNVGSPHGVDGMKQVAVLAEFFEFFQHHDVDVASIWALQQRTQNDLSGDEGIGILTVAGEFFQIMGRSIVGKTLHESAEGTDGLRTYLWADAWDNVTVVLVNDTDATRAQAFDIGALATAGERIALSRLSAWADPSREDAHARPDAVAMLSVEGMAAPSGALTLDFAPGEVIVLTVARTEGFDIQSDLSVRAEHGTTGAESFTASRFDDVIAMGAGEDTVHGGDGDDLLRGGAGDDILDGGAGADTLHGGDGDDTLIGGGGLDEMWGGAGADTFVFDTVEEALAAAPRIMDFSAGTDRLVLRDGSEVAPVAPEPLEPVELLEPPLQQDAFDFIPMIGSPVRDVRMVAPAAQIAQCHMPPSEAAPLPAWRMAQSDPEPSSTQVDMMVDGPDVFLL